MDSEKDDLVRLEKVGMITEIMRYVKRRYPTVSVNKLE